MAEWQLCIVEFSRIRSTIVEVDIDFPFLEFIVFILYFSNDVTKNDLLYFIQK